MDKAAIRNAMWTNATQSTLVFLWLLRSYLLGSDEYVITLISSVIGAANPVITWFSIQKAWQGEIRFVGGVPEQSRKGIKTFSKAAAIVNLVFGAFFFVFTFPFMITDGYEAIMLLFILPGAAVTGFSIGGIVTLFGKNSRYRRWLDMLMKVIFWIFCGALDVFLIVCIVVEIISNL